jgi:hypothetical protein
MTKNIEDVVAEDMTESLLDDQDKKPKNQYPERKFYGEAHEAGGYDSTAWDLFEEEGRMPADQKPIWTMPPIPKFLRRGGEVEAARGKVLDTSKMRRERGAEVAKIRMKDAEEMAYSMGRFLGEVLENSGILWTEEAAKEFKFAAMKGLAQCKQKNPKVAGPAYLKIVITADVDD